jgi:serine/threonine protein kinase
MGTRASVSVGSLLAGRYRLVEPLPGAAAGTWRARDDIGDRDVAARKLPLVPGEVQAAVRQRAVHEAREAARLRHAGIVAVYDVVEHDGSPWVVTELVPAPSLDHVLRTRGPVPPIEAARIGLRVLGRWRWPMPREYATGT